MNWRRIIDPIFPIIEPFDAEQMEEINKKLNDDLDAIRAARWSPNDERALNEALRIAAAETERVKTAESKATTYLAVLAALVPVIITIQSSDWEKKSGPAPEWAKLILLTIATTYTAAAGFHAFKTLQVAGFQRVGEFELVTAWRSRFPLHQLTRETLIASRSSRKTINAKVTRILMTHAHMIRAFAAFILLLLLDPLFSVFGDTANRTTPEIQKPSSVVIVDCSQSTTNTEFAIDLKPRSEMAVSSTYKMRGYLQ